MKLQTEEQMKEIIERYFNDCIKKEWLPTKNGLVSVLDITRNTYCVWKKKSNALKVADHAIENQWVQNLTKNNVAGTIFYLKNAFGYRDRQDIDHTSGGKPIPLFDNTTTKK